MTIIVDGLHLVSVGAYWAGENDMRKNMHKVIDAFMVRKAIKGDSKMTIWTDGDTIYSYSVPIAKWDRDRNIVIVDSKYVAGGAASATTRNQVYALNRWASIKSDKNNTWVGFGPSLNGHSVRKGRPETDGSFRSSRKVLCDEHDDCKTSDALAEACAR